MPDSRQASSGVTPGQKLAALLVVVVAVLGTWKFIDHRSQPPPPPSVAASLGDA